MVHRIAYAVALAIALAACGGTDETTLSEETTEATVAVAEGEVGASAEDPAFDQTWADGAGQEQPDGLSSPGEGLVINTQRGPEHCGWEQAVIMLVAFPFGTEASGAEAIRQYVRDPQDVLRSPSIKSDFDPAVVLPDDAEPTGLYNRDRELWTAPSTAEREVYVGNDEGFEAWPRADPRIGCD